MSAFSFNQDESILGYNKASWFEKSHLNSFSKHIMLKLDSD